SAPAARAAGLGRAEAASAEPRKPAPAAPFPWYAQLARARLAAAGIEVGPFGDRGPQDVAGLPDADPALARDPLIVRVDELLAAGMDVEAGLELHRGEKAFLGRRGTLAILIDRYDRAGNANRPFELAEGRGRALDSSPAGAARAWWEHAYPRAYRGFIEKYQALGDNPPYYLYSIMRKESAYDPHVVSYADA